MPPNIRRLQLACRQIGIEVIYSIIENMTRGCDCSIDHKISGIDVPCGSWKAKILNEMTPAEHEMIFRKT